MYSEGFTSSNGITDFVLVWDSSSESSISEQSIRKRFIFERNLKKEGLHLKEHPSPFSATTPSNLHYICISVPKDVLCRYCEILKIRLPMKPNLAQQLLKYEKDQQLFQDEVGFGFDEEFLDFDEESKATVKKKKKKSVSCWQRLKKKYLKISPDLIPASYHQCSSVKSTGRLSAVYSRSNQYLFSTEEIKSGTIFTANVKSRVLDFILKRTHFTEEEIHNEELHQIDAYNFGINKLIKDGVYTAAFPLHDGDFELHEERVQGHRRYPSLRSLLHNEWASLTKIQKYQPLNLIKEYFGVRIGVYYSWLGLYTWMLAPISLLGLACFLYGVGTLTSNDHVRDICNVTSGIIMCPLCNKYCGYWNLSDTCIYSKLAYMFDNDATVAFAVAISLWTILFLEYWKRYSASLFYNWDLNHQQHQSSSSDQNEHPRPEYLARLRKVKRQRVNHVTQRPEPALSFYRHKLPKLIFSGSISWLLISMAIVALLGVIMYRLSVKVFVLQTGHSGSGGGSKASSSSSLRLLFVNISAVFINLIFILTFNQLYSYLATWLTEMELHRTQSEFDTSLTLKIYLLQFVNFYSSIFYIAFFKGKFSGSPPNYGTIFGYRNEECSPGGCMSELCIQLAIIMIGKQMLNALMEMTLPLVKQLIRKHLVIGRGKPKDNDEGLHHESLLTTTKVASSSSLTFYGGTLQQQPQWTQDYELLEWNTRSLFPEYLEMILQFGFITIFSSAFPLGPLFALLNNIFEMRLDGKKMLRHFRRPVNTGSIGDAEIWITILNIIAKIGVISNGFIIAFTSSFIPKLIYRLEMRQSGLDGFLDWSLASFNTSNFDRDTKPAVATTNAVVVCRYESYYRSDKDQGGILYWKIMLARFMFAVIFQNFVFSCQVLLEWLIPDVPKELNDKIRQEEYLTNEMVIKYEQLRNENTRKFGQCGEAKKPRVKQKQVHFQQIQQLGRATSVLSIPGSGDLSNEMQEIESEDDNDERQEDMSMSGPPSSPSPQNLTTVDQVPLKSGSSTSMASSSEEINTTKL